MELSTFDQRRDVLKIKKYKEFSQTDKLNKPEWLKVRVCSDSSNGKKMRTLLQEHSLSTVCDQANCPNIAECFNKKRATFLIMGKICTRRCPFCDVAHGYPDPLDPNEPYKLARAVSKLGLHYVVITSVDRDDLKDGGAEHFAKCVQAIRELGNIKVELLVPDFRGRVNVALQKLISCPPDVFNHNIETVPRLYKEARPGGNYLHSLRLLKQWSEQSPTTPTKSGLMVGLGESDDEIYSVMHDLREHGVSMLTIGQYIAPSRFHIPVRRYVHPDVFQKYAEKAKELGFLGCLSGPLVRSSYGAQEQITEAGYFK